MRRLLLISLAVTLALVGCRGGGEAKKGAEAGENTAQTRTVLTDAADWDKVYRKIDATAIAENPIELIGEQWMLVTSGDAGSFNTMTASWGAMGELWSRHVTMITIRNIRYTNEFLEKNDTYTLSFFDEQYKPTLQMLGTKSGRDTYKIEESGLTPVATPVGSMSFGEARMIIECRKLYAGPLEQKYMTPEIVKLYPNTTQGYHILYVGEIINVWVPVGGTII